MKITLGQYFNQAIDIYRSASLEEKIATTTLGVLLLVTAGLMPATRIDAGDSALVNIYVDGEKRSLTTNAATVAEVLDRADILLSEHDLVEPSIEAEITNEVFNINIYRAYPAVIIDGDDRHEVISAYDSARLIVRHSGVVDIHDEDKVYMDLVVDLSGDRYVGRKVIIERATPVSLSLGGEDLTVRTHATTVGEMFGEMDIEVGNNDILKPSLDTKITPGISIALTQIGFETVAVTEEVEPETETIYDNDRPIGYESIESEGSHGRAKITYEVEYQNGEEVNRRVLHRLAEVEPSPRVVVVGNRNTHTGDSNRKIGYQIASDRGLSNSEWSCLEQLWTRESNWNNTARNPSSGAFGIPQGMPLPGRVFPDGFMEGDPVAQINWGLDYIAGRYSAPCTAWNYFLANNTY
ncbi:MAG: ubiquitin-like domain-containing protein [Candidatus Saccharimonadales bacterium]